MRRALVCLLWLPLLAACSGGDTELPGEGDAAPTTLPGETPAPPPSFSGVGSGRFCELAQGAEQELNKLGASWPSPSATRDVFTSASQSVNTLAEVAPDEIKPDVAVVAAAYAQLVEGLAAVDWDPARVSLQLTEKLGAPEVTAAGDRVQEYERAVCGLNP